MEVPAGTQTAPSFAQPELWALVDGLAEQSRPIFLRGDCHWGAEKAMAGAEERQLRYLFKLKQSANVKKLIRQIFQQEEWMEAGQQWEGPGDEVRLKGGGKGRGGGGGGGGGRGETARGGVGGERKRCRRKA